MIGAWVSLAALMTAGWSQAADDPGAPAALPVPAGHVRIAAGTVVTVAVAETISSKTGAIDQMFAIRLAEPIVIDGKVAVPAGVTGKGQVIHAAKARAMGKAGELTLAARSIDCGTTPLALRGFRLGGKGDDKTGIIVAGQAVAGLLATPMMFISGGEKVIPTGTLGTAKLAAPIDIRISPDAACTAPPAVPLSVQLGAHE